MSRREEPAQRSVPKVIAGIAVVVVAAGAVAIGLARETNRSRRISATTTIATPAEKHEAVTVYYFHGDTRCPTCRAIEARTAKVVHEEFESELADGTLRFEVVNFDTPENRHFRDDYDLSFGSVVVQGAGDHRPWENLADVWIHVKAEPAVFEAYLVEHITHMLDAAG